MFKSVLLSVLLGCVALVRAFPGFPRESEKLILVLVDGVRWDYMNDTSLVGFQRIANNGVRAEYVTPVFPSNSYPNWYSIVTGLYPESHGIVQNYMYDKDRDDLFLMALHSNASHPHWWNGAEPIWVTAEKRELKSAVYWWDGCQVVIHGKRPVKCEEYANYWIWGRVNKDTQDALLEILDKFQKDGFRLGMVYYEAVDANGHFSGPDSKERKQSLRDIDSILNLLQEEIAKRGMEQQVNLAVVSDHGMTSIDPNAIEIVDIEKSINLDDVKLMLDRGAMSMILPIDGKDDKVYKDLKMANIKGLNVYKKSEIPEKYHLKNHPLVQPILLVADKGYFIQALSDPKKMKPLVGRIFKGHHGYDPYKVEDMRTIFYARGPSFKKGYVSGPLDMVDHYNALCRAMGMEPLPNNGSWPRVRELMTGAALRLDTHVGRDSQSKGTFLGKKRSNASHKKTKGVFRGKRKNAPSLSGLSIHEHSILTIVMCVGISFLLNTSWHFQADRRIF